MTTMQDNTQYTVESLPTGDAMKSYVFPKSVLDEEGISSLEHFLQTSSEESDSKVIHNSYDHLVTAADARGVDVPTLTSLQRRYGLKGDTLIRTDAGNEQLKPLARSQYLSAIHHVLRTNGASTLSQIVAALRDQGFFVYVPCVQALLNLTRMPDQPVAKFHPSALSVRPPSQNRFAATTTSSLSYVLDPAAFFMGMHNSTVGMAQQSMENMRAGIGQALDIVANEQKLRTQQLQGQKEQRDRDRSYLDEQFGSVRNDLRNVSTKQDQNTQRLASEIQQSGMKAPRRPHQTTSPILDCKQPGAGLFGTPPHNTSSATVNPNDPTVAESKIDLSSSTLVPTPDNINRQVDAMRGKHQSIDWKQHKEDLISKYGNVDPSDLQVEDELPPEAGMFYNLDMVLKSDPNSLPKEILRAENISTICDVMTASLGENPNGLAPKYVLGNNLLVYGTDLDTKYIYFQVNTRDPTFGHGGRDITDINVFHDEVLPNLGMEISLTLELRFDKSAIRFVHNESESEGSEDSHGSFFCQDDDDESVASSPDYSRMDGGGPFAAVTITGHRKSKMTEIVGPLVRDVLSKQPNLLSVKISGYTNASTDIEFMVEKGDLKHLANISTLEELKLERLLLGSDYQDDVASIGCKLELICCNLEGQGARLLNALSKQNKLQLKLVDSCPIKIEFLTQGVKRGHIASLRMSSSGSPFELQDDDAESMKGLLRYAKQGGLGVGWGDDDSQPLQLNFVLPNKSTKSTGRYLEQCLTAEQQDGSNAASSKAGIKVGDGSNAASSSKGAVAPKAAAGIKVGDGGAVAPKAVAVFKVGDGSKAASKVAPKLDTKKKSVAPKAESGMKVGDGSKAASSKVAPKLDTKKKPGMTLRSKRVLAPPGP